MSDGGKGFIQRGLDVASHEPLRVGAAAALGALAGFAPVDSGLFALLAFLIVFTDATFVVAAAIGAVGQVVSFAALDGQASELGRQWNENPSSAHEFVCGFPVVALLGLEKHRVLGGLLLGAGAAPVLALIAFVIQKKVFAARQARERREKKEKTRRAKNEPFKVAAKVRASEDAWAALPSLKKWILLAGAIAAAHFLGSNAAGRWVLEEEVPSLVSSELGACGPVRAEEVEASLLGAHIHARNVSIKTEKASLTVPELDVQLDWIGLLRRRFIAKHVEAKNARLVLEQGAWPLPAAKAPEPRKDANEALASLPRWTIWHADMENLEIVMPDKKLVAKTGELVEIRPRAQASKLEPPEARLKGEGFELDLDGLKPVTVARSNDG